MVFSDSEICRIWIQVLFKHFFPSKAWPRHDAFSLRCNLKWKWKWFLFLLFKSFAEIACRTAFAMIFLKFFAVFYYLCRFISYLLSFMFHLSLSHSYSPSFFLSLSLISLSIYLSHYHTLQFSLLLCLCPKANKAKKICKSIFWPIYLEYKTIWSWIEGRRHFSEGKQEVSLEATSLHLTRIASLPLANVFSLQTSMTLNGRYSRVEQISEVMKSFFHLINKTV